MKFVDDDDDDDDDVNMPVQRRMLRRPVTELLDKLTIHKRPSLRSQLNSSSSRCWPPRSKSRPVVYQQ